MNIKELIFLIKEYNYNLSKIGRNGDDLDSWHDWPADCKAVLDAKEKIKTLEEYNKKIEQRLNFLGIDFSIK
jgi:hypothetical protein